MWDEHLPWWLYSAYIKVLQDRYGGEFLRLAVVNVLIRVQLS